MTAAEVEALRIAYTKQYERQMAYLNELEVEEV